jgi:WD40 repeat protein
MANEGLFEGHTDQITSVHFSLNGEYILTGSKDTTIRLWNLKGKQLHSYKGNDK